MMRSSDGLVRDDQMNSTVKMSPPPETGEKEESTMEQHILKYEFHISKVLKFIEIY